ncbi:MAG: M14 family metallopeptidase [Bacillota bacterium]|jgi:murein tripeptide amidase MpaA
MTGKVDLVCNRYYQYEELTAYLQAVAAAYPRLASLASIGKSYEGRDIWAMTLTNRDTGEHAQKPAVYVDGNIHAGEVTASMVCLYTIDYLTSNYQKDELVTHLLDTRTFYILPRVNPDGAEKYLTTPATLRSSTKPYPDPLQVFEELPGLHPADIDGDGWILTMRVRDDKKGEWKVSDKDPRLLVARRPGERQGPFYRLFSEGMIKQFEGEPFDIWRSPFGLDMNRNFPQNWDLEVNGGGAYPGSEPEAKAIMDFVLAHKNISILNAFHTHGGFFYRNPYQYGDDKMDQDDLRATREIAREGTYVTGYPDVKSNNRATLTEWAYEQHGIIAYTTELWDRLGKAGIKREEFMAADTPERKEELQLRLLQWNDRELGGKGFFDWRAFEHPQLGLVEIGGWNPKYVLQNPPQQFLQAECHKNCQWVLRQAGALPEATLGEYQVQEVAEDIWKITVLCENAGYLPTYTTNKGKQVKAVQSDRVRIAGYQQLLAGKPEVEIGFLEGYLNGQGGGYFIRPAQSAARVSWLVKSPAGSSINITLHSQRGGVARITVELK